MISQSMHGVISIHKIIIALGNIGFSAYRHVQRVTFEKETFERTVMGRTEGFTSSGLIYADLPSP